MKEKFREFIQEIELRMMVISRAFLKALSNDYMFTLLPIAIIGMIRGATGNLGSDIWLWPDWSFASIVLLGASISKYIHAKSGYEKDFSFRLFLGVRLMTFLLILAVVTLSLAILKESIQTINSQFVSLSQMVILSVSILVVFYNHIVIQRHIEYSWYSEVKDNSMYFEMALRNVDRALNRVRYLSKITQTYTNENRKLNRSFVDDIDDSWASKDLKAKLSILRNEVVELQTWLDKESIDNHEHIDFETK